jgi:hypothetical protein
MPRQPPKYERLNEDFSGLSAASEIECCYPADGSLTVAA